MRAYHAVLLLFALTFSVLPGCMRYTVPGPGAPMEAFGVVSADQRDQLTDQQIQHELARKPLVSFPAGICLAHVQSTDYRNAHGYAYGRGAYSVVTMREVETEDQLNRLASMPMVRGVATVNRLLLPSQLNSDMELRQAAAKLHTQVLLIYTFDTHFYHEDNATPLDVITLGFGGHKKVRITCTASAALLDVRNGYIYGVAEATTRSEQDTSSWNNEAGVDESRRKAESEALEKLVDELSVTWSNIIRQYAGVYKTVTD